MRNCAAGGKPTAIWGNEASVLVGDFPLLAAFQMMVRLDSMRVMRILADTTNRIAEGEVLPVAELPRPDVDEARYFEVIYSKTAKGCSRVAGRLRQSSPAIRVGIEQALAEYGMRLGTAFQLVDDLLDYTAPPATRSARTSAMTSPKASRRCR